MADNVLTFPTSDPPGAAAASPEICALRILQDLAIGYQRLADQICAADLSAEEALALMTIIEAQLRQLPEIKDRLLARALT